MPWFRLDDSFHSHPKVLAAGNEAVGLFVRCGTYAAEHLTDGQLPRDIVLLYGSEVLAEKLVVVRLWHRARRGWLIHDYLDYNPSRQAVENDRKNAAERQKRRRESMSSRRDSQRDNGVSHRTPTRPLSNAAPFRPAPFARARDPISDSRAEQHPSARTVAQAIAESTQNGNPA